MKNYDKLNGKWFSPKKEIFLKWFDSLDGGRLPTINYIGDRLGICNATIRIFVTQLVKNNKIAKIHIKTNVFEYIKVKSKKYE